MSESKLLAALFKAQEKAEPAIKDADNPFTKKKYADLASVDRTFKKFFVPQGLGRRWKSKSDASGVSVKCILFHSSGEELVPEDWLFLPASPGTPQVYGSGLTYGRRYTLMAEAGIVADDDDDGHLASATAPLALVNGEVVQKPPEQAYSKHRGAWVARFGKSKGKKASELDDKNLAWYLEKARESLADPEKAKFEAMNRQDVAELEEEADKRHGKKEPSAFSNHPTTFLETTKEALAEWLLDPRSKAHSKFKEKSEQMNAIMAELEHRAEQ